MKVLVLGAGALGSVIGGFLARHNKVVLVGREWHLNSIEKDGLKISGIWGDHKIKDLILCKNKESFKDLLDTSFDLVLITVKSYDTERILTEYLPMIKGDSVFASAQNGLGNLEILERFVPSNRVIGIRVIFGAEVIEPGHVKVTVCADEVKVGSLTNDFDSQKLQDIVLAFNQAGIPAGITFEIVKHIWAKVIYNCCLNGLAALLEVSYGRLGENSYTRQIMTRICEEIFEVTNAKQIHLWWKNASEYLEHFFTQLIPLTASHHASMLQDIKKGRKTEIDALNGAIYRLACEEGLQAPYNHLIWAQVKAKEEFQRR
jgi:2-dehydropantoate 2-reductase